jgi:RimJ/RimL family protein N-acetyltransferase
VPVLRTPLVRIDDGVIALRRCVQADLGSFEDAAQPDGNDGIWLIPVAGGPGAQLAAHVTSGPVGPALTIARSADDQLVGIVYLTDRGAGSVELSYGVAPAHRGQGIATRAARLAAAWALREGGWDQVELRIADDAAASRRVAVKAGFAEAGRVRTWVASAGEEFEDCLYVMRP